MKRSARPWRGYGYALAWSLGTACAAAIAWHGVYGVYRSGIEGERAGAGLIIYVPQGAVAGAPEGTRRSAPEPGPGAPSGRGSRHDAGPDHGASGRGARAGAGATSRSYPLAGGVVVLAQSATSARLVTARPAAGWGERSWSGAGWLRVEFRRGDRVGTLIATWNGHPPQIQYDNHPGGGAAGAAPDTGAGRDSVTGHHR